MDTLSEHLSEDPGIGITLGDMHITCLEYIDDVNTFSIGYKQQESTLQAMNNFAFKRQLEWGESKCKVMEIGKHKEKKDSRKLGTKTITKGTTYKYLGEITSRDGKSEANISERFQKTKATVISIMTCARSDIMRKIETNVPLKLHDTVAVSTMSQIPFLNM